MPDDEDPGLELNWKGRAPRGEDAQEQPPPQTQGLAQAGKGLPGDPQYMSDELRLQLSGPGVRVHQFRETLEILVGVNQANHYEVSSLEGRPIFYAAERGGFLIALLRNFNPFHRRHLECTTVTGIQALTIDYPFAMLRRRGEVCAWDGRALGTIQQRFSLLRTWIDIQTPAGITQLSIIGPILKYFSSSDWVFTVKQGDRVVGRIRKHWGGLFREAFTRADNFTLELDESFTDGRERQLLVAAALTLDLVQFEQQSNRGNGSLLNMLNVFKLLK